MNAVRTEAKGRLLAAEVDYLTASGWKPSVDRKGRVKWQGMDSVRHQEQDTAVELQKYLDREEERAAALRPI